MSASATWQVAGAALELVGLWLVATGIVNAREHFAPDLLGLVGTVRVKARAALARFPWRKPRSGDAVVLAGTAMAGAGAMSARATVGLRAWDDDIPTEERLLDLRRMIEMHARDLDELYRRQGAEETARTSADKDQQRQHAELERRLNTELREATTSDLRRQAWGVACFALGLLLGTLGNVLG